MRSLLLSGAALLSLSLSGRAQDEWGTVVDTPSGIQATGWFMRLQGLQAVPDAQLFVAHDPELPSAPKIQTSSGQLVDLNPGGSFPAGKAQSIQVRSMTNKRLPPNMSTKEPEDAIGHVFADCSVSSFDVGFPYVASPNMGGVQQSPIGVHAEGLKVSAYSQPGKPISFTLEATGGYVSVAGTKVVDLPPIWPANFAVRIPEDASQPAVANIVFNEQVTTDELGVPTTGPDGHFKFDAKATSGYVNAIHLSLLGTEVADITIGHAAVIRNKEKTDNH
ncbi:hypothetical protein GQ42DRAFT_172270 [Ramicandelaber brevisporus]|nr:hypothetical protein GQ42DRAFT_172270 [Ramicandelaber brevisporus]